MTKQEFKDILAVDLTRFSGKTIGLKDLILRNEAFYIESTLTNISLVLDSYV